MPAPRVEITLIFERRKDGGLRLWSPELPGLMFSHPDPLMLIADISPALNGFAYPLDEGFLAKLFRQDNR